MKSLLSTAAFASLGFVVPALAAPMVQPTHDLYACVDPRATTALAIPDGRLSNRKWVDYVHRTGHCVVLPASQQFEVVAQQGPLVLVKPIDATSDTPPVYAQQADMQQSAAPQDPAAQAGPGTVAAQAAPGTVAAQAAPATIAAQAAPATIAAQAAPAQQQQPDQVPAQVATPAADPPVAPSQVSTQAPAQPADQPAVPAAASAPPPAATPSAPVAQPPPPAPDNAAPVTAPLGTPAPATAPVRSSGVSALLILLVVLALVALVGVAVAIARQQRRFAHVEDRNWPPEDDGRDPLGHAAPAAAAPPRPARSPQAFRRDCVAVLEQGGWAIQPSFTVGAAEEDGSPDIVGRKQNAVLAVRCRAGDEQVNLAMIDEAATMGRRANAHVTVLATEARLTQRAHDEALRLHVHVLPIEELDSLSA
jgi:hypothetical protein